MNHNKQENCKNADDGSRQVEQFVIPPTLEEIENIIVEFTFANDEWGGSKIANWQYGNNLVVDGITEAAEAILGRFKAV